MSALQRCCSLNRSLFLLDEPFSGMDIEGRSHLVQILKTIVARQDTGMIISSHLIHDIEQITTKVCIVSDGKWLGTKRADEIKKSHATIEEYYLHSVNANISLESA